MTRRKDRIQQATIHHALEIVISVLSSITSRLCLFAFIQLCYPSFNPLVVIPGFLTHAMNNDNKAKVDQASETTQDPAQVTGPDTEQQSHPRSSLDSTATELPAYRRHPDRPPSYNKSRIYDHWRNVSEGYAGPSNSKGRPFDATAVNAVLATSSSNTDKMHSKPSGRVEDWNEDSTYKSRLRKLGQGSSRKWNYFGADIGGNPFRRSGKDK